MEKMAKEIKLGDKVKCKYTGFTGIAVAKTEFINGCVQFIVQPKYDKKDLKLPIDQEMSIDETSLILIDTKLRKEDEKDLDNDIGGSNKIIRRRNY